MAVDHRLAGGQRAPPATTAPIDQPPDQTEPPPDSEPPQSDRSASPPN